jgi:hypothetical protein
MNYYHLLGSLNEQLKQTVRLYFQNSFDISDEYDQRRLVEIKEKVIAMIMVFKREIGKGNHI